MQNRLRRKGWSSTDLAKLDKYSVKRLHLFWIVIISAVLVNMVLAFVFIPVFLGLKNVPMFALVIATGVCFGLLFFNLLRNVDVFTYRHHLAVAIVPAFAAVSIFFSSEIANSVAPLLHSIRHSSVMLGLLYAFSFELPIFIGFLYIKD
ncbi:MAG: hypothetical protein V1837_07460 [Candidatus Woesearchaeota archaeon]